MIVSGLICVALWRFRARTELPVQDFGSEKKEIAWILGPIIIVLWIAAISAKLVLTLNAVPKAHPAGEGAADLIVTGHQWWWEIEYPNTNIVAANEVHIPVGEKLRVSWQSADVIHCFWVPRNRPKNGCDSRWPKLHLVWKLVNPAPIKAAVQNSAATNMLG